MMAALAELGIDVAIDEMPNELPDPIRFSQDRAHASYDPDAVQRFWQILVNADRVFKQFRTGFLGKASPVHFFWGSFDLAVTRFSGRRAPRHPGGVPHLPDAVAREAYSHEVSSAGFWPGGGAIDYPAFYSYAYPEPAGFRRRKVRAGRRVLQRRSSASSSCPMTPCARPTIPTARCSISCKAPTRPPPNAAKWDRDALECDPGTAGRGKAGLARRAVGWAKPTGRANARPMVNCTCASSFGLGSWWARRKRAFAHPTT